MRAKLLSGPSGRINTDFFITINDLTCTLDHIPKSPHKANQKFTREAKTGSFKRLNNYLRRFASDNIRTIASSASSLANVEMAWVAAGRVLSPDQQNCACACIVRIIYNYFTYMITLEMLNILFNNQVGVFKYYFYSFLLLTNILHFFNFFELIVFV